MSRIDKLIAQHCPNGVGFRPIGELAKCFQGRAPTPKIAAYWDGGTIPIMFSGEAEKGWADGAGAKITTAGFDACGALMVPPNTIVITLAGHSTKARGLAARTRIALCVGWDVGAIICGEEIHSDFLYHVLRAQRQQLQNLSYGDGCRYRINLNILRGYNVPVPPMEVQQEVAGVLNALSQLGTELEVGLGAALAGRRQQYRHYRDQLLSFSC